MTGQEWIELADRLKYPVLAAFVVFVFRSQIGALLLRLQELGWLGGKAKFRPPQNQNAASAKAATEEIKDSAVVPRAEPTIIVPALAPSPSVSTDIQPMNLPKSRLQIEVEGYIRNDSKLHGLNDGAKVELLIHHQAVVQIEVAFERLYRLIFGSQVKAIREANRPGGIPSVRFRAIFEQAKVEFPEMHAHRTFDQWAGWLVQAGLGMELPPQDGVEMASITIRGQEFLLYLTRMGYPDPWA